MNATRLALALVLIGRVADMSTTMLGMAHGAVEANPPMAAAFAVVGPLPAMLTMTLVLAALTYGLTRMHRGLGLAAAFYIYALGLLMAVNNLSVLAALSR